MLNRSYLSLLSLFAFMATFTQASAHAQERPLVVFFGGFKASKAQMDAWKKAVQKALPNYDVEAIPYPSTSASGSAAVSAGQVTLNRLANLINSRPGREVVIAGHSSGSALSNALARKVTDPQNVRLVALDGYSPDQGLQKRFQTTCWSASNKNNKARNYGTSKSNCGRNFRTATMNGSGCTSAWCLHFAMINKNASFGNDWSTGGYANLEPNTDWITEGSRNGGGAVATRPASRDEGASVSGFIVDGAGTR